MIPTVRADLAQVKVTPEAELPSQTYKIDFEAGRIVGTVDGREAVRQAVQKILRTERFSHLIYSWGYGMEWRTLTGRSRGVVESELGRLLTEALTADGRVVAVKDVSIIRSGRNAATVFVTVDTKYGEIKEEVAARV